MPQKNDIGDIREALLTARLQLEQHLADNECWRALKTAELGAIVARHLGSDAEEDNKKLHRKLLRTSSIYRAYARLIEAVRILSDTERDSSAAGEPDVTTHEKPRIRIKARSLSVPDQPLPKTRAA